jgi:hypothetical protein
MLIHYTLQKIAMGHIKWTTITCIHPTSLGSSSW